MTFSNAQDHVLCKAMLTYIQLDPTELTEEKLDKSIFLKSTPSKMPCLERLWLYLGDKQLKAVHKPSLFYTKAYGVDLYIVMDMKWHKQKWTL